MKRTAIIAGAVAAVLVALGAYGVTKFTTDQAQVAAPTSVNMTGVSAAAGSSRSFAAADHVHSTSGTLPGTRGGTGVSGSPSVFGTITSSPAITTAAFNKVLYVSSIDTDSAYSSGTFTVPAGKGGAYLVICAIQWNSAFTAAAAGSNVFKGVTNVAQNLIANPAAGTNSITTIVYTFAAGDTVSCQAYQNSGSNQSLSNGAQDNYVSIKRLPD